MYTFTINTDASLHPQTQTGGWACWIKSSSYKITSSGLLPGKIPNSGIAELLAVEQALILLNDLIHHQDFLQAQDKIKLYFNTDSTFVINTLHHNVKRTRYPEIVQRVQSLTTDYVIDVRHVKAHTNKKDARSYVNNWCDRAAKYHVRRKVRELHDPRIQKV